MNRFHERVMDVYFDDLDPYRILHNARYVLMFERTVGSLWREMGFGALQDDDHPDRFHFVRASSVAYEAPVRGVGQVRVRVWVGRLGHTSLTFAFRMLAADSDLVHAQGERTVVRVHPQTWRPVPWTDGFRERVSAWGGTSVG